MNGWVRSDEDDLMRAVKINLHTPHNGELLKFSYLEQLREFIWQHTDNTGQKPD